MSGDGVASFFPTHPNFGRRIDLSDAVAAAITGDGEPIVAKVYGDNGVETVAFTRSAKCGERHKAGWFCSRAYDHTGACAMWPVSHDARMSEMLATPARQSRADSFMESLTNIAIGLAVSQVANLIVLPLVFHVPVSNGQALALGLIYTAISLVRSYALRRAFNGRSVWQAIKGHWA